MSIDTTHPEYDANLAAWTLARDCAAGSQAVKAGRTTYLPMPNSDDQSAENRTRYNDYLFRANFVNFTGATLKGMLGMVFREDSKIELQQSIEYLEENANGAGLTLDQMVRGATSEVLTTARLGLMVDYPQAPQGLTRADEEAMYLRANILAYAAEDCLNWGAKVIGGVTKLSLVVLKEAKRVWGDDGFSSEEKEYHRVLRLIDGKYQQELYDEKDNLVEGPFNPTKADGSYFDEIPFLFAGAQNNDSCVDHAPIYDVAETNLSHFQNSADFEESSFFVGQPTLALTGLSQGWVDEIMKGGVMLGSRAPILLPVEGGASLLQANPNQMPERGMAMKEEQMVKIGARIIRDTGGAETAEAARIRYAGQTSELATVVGNIESALLQCLEWAMEFMGGDGENEIEINRDFYEKTADPQLIIAGIQALDRGVIAMSDLRDKMREVGMIEGNRTDEEIDGEAEQQEIMI